MDLGTLIEDLEKAEIIASQYSGGYSERFLSAEEFHAALKDKIKKLKEGKYFVIDELNIWFLPTSDWDDFIGEEGIEIGNKISKQLSRLQKKLDIKEININSFNSIDNLHSHFKTIFQFPDFYGKNWDAFWDSITGLVEMPDLTFLYGWAEFKNKFERDSEILKEIVEDFNKEIANKKIIIRDKVNIPRNLTH